VGYRAFLLAATLAVVCSTFLYHATLHVPLALAGPGVHTEAAERQRSETRRMAGQQIDHGDTVERALFRALSYTRR